MGKPILINIEENDVARTPRITATASSPGERECGVEGLGIAIKSRVEGTMIKAFALIN